MPDNGPYQTEHQARAAVRHILDTEPGTGAWQRASYALLTGAAGGAGVEAGAYDLRILNWLAGYEPQACAVIAGLITRAHEAGRGTR